MKREDYLHDLVKNAHDINTLMSARAATIPWGDDEQIMNLAREVRSKIAIMHALVDLHFASLTPSMKIYYEVVRDYFQLLSSKDRPDSEVSAEIQSRLSKTASDFVQHIRNNKSRLIKVNL